MLLIGKKAYFDYHEYDIGLTKISLNSDEIKISSYQPDLNNTIRLQDIDFLSVTYKGFDEGPRHPVFSPRAKRGTRNMIYLKDKKKLKFEAEIYLPNKKQAMILRNNIQYYRDLGIKDKKSYKRSANTDGIINGLVMVFAKPCSHDRSCQNLHPDTRICPQYKSCTVTVFWLRSNLYRDTAPVPIRNICYIVIDSWLTIKLVPRHAYLRSKLVPGWQKPRRTLLAP